MPCPATPQFPYSDWIEKLANDGITVGCGGGKFCPDQTLTTWMALAWLSNAAVGHTPYWPSYHPLPREATITYRDEQNRVITEAGSGSTLTQANTVVTRDNLFQGSMLVASRIWTGTPTFNFFSSDHLGTPRLATTAGAAFLELRKYWPYGDDFSSTGTPSGERLKFATMERDDEANHYYDHARTHDFGTGRFLSPDLLSGRPRSPQTWNRYTYAGSNPIKYVDRTGLVFVLSGCASGNATQCTLQKKLLLETVGAAAYAHLHIDAQGRVTTFGDAADFAAFGTAQRGLAALMSSRSVFSLITDNPSKAAQGEGAITEALKGGGANIYIDPSRFPHLTGNVLGTTITAFVHEEGHALSLLFPRLAAQFNSNPRNSVFVSERGEAYPVNFEDRYRKDVGIDSRYSYFLRDSQDTYLDPDTELVPTINPQ